jgi:hypothetical protein
VSLRHRIKLIADQAPDGTVDPDYTGTPFMTGIPCLISDVRGMEKYRRPADRSDDRCGN